MTFPENPLQRGFTLLEIMVAMVVLSLIMTATFGALRLGERSWETSLAQTAKTETLRTTSKVLQRLLSQMLPQVWERKTEKFLAFQGEADRLRFVGPAPSHHGATGLFEYELSFSSERDGGRLRLRYHLHNPDRNAFVDRDADHHEVILVDELESLEFSYYGAPEEKREPGWQDRWSDESETYPGVVRLQLVSRLERDQWPVFYLPLHTEQLP